MSFTRKDACTAIENVARHTSDVTKLEELGRLRSKIDCLSDATLAEVDPSWAPTFMMGFLLEKVAKAVAAAAAAQPPAAQPGA
eukprot:CAMPEP_0202866140 /NCGR_PEP_ID=MMETSP1391-20130828/7227_1 /ASSEMBLY_ACC=CAM_ASM_000867 /TAXON_ID=1034604 /ORGANISM="Chlamydomonas leiostraca, Strain SAG 11-49" /LENGTH=82 /DNA_ID=CAMNT_0049546063 /DNA_START=107 /DNA_END=351 /DNA_ORIENTATION=+